MALKVKAVEQFALPKSFPSISQALSKHIASSNSHFEYANTLPTLRQYPTNYNLAISEQK
jgi:hypothetical protein